MAVTAKEILTELKDFRKEVRALLDKKVDKEMCVEKHKEESIITYEIYTKIPNKFNNVYKTMYGLIFGSGGLLIMGIAILKFFKIL